MFTSRFFVTALLVLVAALSRLVPHPANFAPVMAIALFSGAHSEKKFDAFGIPILAMFLSDLVLGFHSLQPVIYGLILGIAYIGCSLRGKVSAVKVGTYAFIGSVVFFIVTNFLVWAFSGMYARTLDGLIQCFVLAIPFFQNSVAGDLFYTTVLFGGMYLIERSGKVNPIIQAV